MPKLLHHDRRSNDYETGLASATAPIVWTERWDDMELVRQPPPSTLISYRGWPVHHAHGVLRPGGRACTT